MAKCAVCKQYTSSGYVICGHCAGQKTLPPELTYYINALAKDLAQVLIHSLNTSGDAPDVLECRTEIRSWLQEKANEYFSRTINA